MASSCARQAERPPGRASYLFGARAGVQRGLLLTIRGGGNRQLTWHTMPTKRMGPAARSFAADAHDCIMVRIQTDLPNTSVRREEMRPMASSPRIEHADINRRHQTLKLRKGPSRGSSSLRVLRRQGAAKHK